MKNCEGLLICPPHKLQLSCRAGMLAGTCDSGSQRKGGWLPAPSSQKQPEGRLAFLPRVPQPSLPGSNGGGAEECGCPPTPPRQRNLSLGTSLLPSGQGTNCLLSGWRRSSLPRLMEEAAWPSGGRQYETGRRLALVQDKQKPERPWGWGWGVASPERTAHLSAVLAGSSQEEPLRSP